MLKPWYTIWIPKRVFPKSFLFPYKRLIKIIIAEASFLSVISVVDIELLFGNEKPLTFSEALSSMTIK